jgi:hypothetical protein
MKNIEIAGVLISHMLESFSSHFFKSLAFHNKRTIQSHIFARISVQHYYLDGYFLLFNPRALEIPNGSTRVFEMAMKYGSILPSFREIYKFCLLTRIAHFTSAVDQTALTSDLLMTTLYNDQKYEKLNENNHNRGKFLRHTARV